MIKRNIIAFMTVVFVFCFICFSNISVAAETISKTALDDNNISKSDLEKVILETKLENSKQTEKLQETIIKKQEEALSNKEELFKAIIEAKNDKIGLLQGNISSILAFLGVVIAIFAIFSFWLSNKIKQTTIDMEILRGQADKTKEKLKVNQVKIDQQQNQANNIQKILGISEQRISERISDGFIKNGKEIPEEVQNVFNHDLNSATNSLNSIITVRSPLNRTDTLNMNDLNLKEIHSILLENENYAKYEDEFEVTIKINKNFSEIDVENVLSQDILRFIKKHSLNKKGNGVHNLKMRTLTAFPLSAKILENILSQNSKGIFKVKSVPNE